MTPREIAIAIRAVAGPAQRPLGRADLDALLRAHPDHEDRLHGRDIDELGAIDERLKAMTDRRSASHCAHGRAALRGG